MDKMHKLFENKTKLNLKQYMTTKKDKLLKQFNEESNELNKSCQNSDQFLNQLFSGVSVYINGVTNPSEIELKRMVVGFGGMYLNHFDAKRTTHTIANNLPFAKTNKLKTNQIVVKPNWITDSIAAKRLLPVEDYLVVKRDLNVRQFLENKDKTIEISGQLVTDLNDLFDSNEVNDKTRTETIETIDLSDRPLVMTTVCEQVLSEDNTNRVEFNRNDYIPNSLAQIDPQFLDSLPISLRQDIMSDINSSYKTNTNNNNNNNKRKHRMKSNKNCLKKVLITDNDINKSNGKTASNDLKYGSDCGLSRGPLDVMFKDVQNQKNGGLLSSVLSANICGKTDTKEVIDLIEEWVNTEEVLIDEDIAYVTKYLLDLIDERKYNRLELISNKLYALVETRSELVWKQCFNDIRNTIIIDLKAIQSKHFYSKAIDRVVTHLPYFKL